MSSLRHAGLLLLLGLSGLTARTGAALDFPEFAPGLSYAREVIGTRPWTIHVVRLDLSHREYQLYSAHADSRAVGMATLARMMASVPAEHGVALAGVNGDFYQRGGTYVGDTRGLQIVDGELISAPADSASFWIDATGQPRTAKTDSKFAVTWPDGRQLAFGLNEELDGARAVLYTPAMGVSTRTRAVAAEIILEGVKPEHWLPLRIGETYQARVREVRRQGNSALAKDTLVLALSPGMDGMADRIQKGELLKIATTSLPDLRGARTAVSGGPVLIHEGVKQDWLKTAKVVGPTGQYSVRSMSEAHPRSGVGWNERFLYLISVDGRNPESVGMTLDELAGYFLQLGCREAMNLDGGGSATMRANGRLVNVPCDPGNRERVIANSLLIVRRADATSAAATSSKSRSSR